MRSSAVLAALLMAPSLFPQIPSALRVQGRVEDGGVPLTGSVDLGLALYTTSSGGSPLATETDAVTLDETGVFRTTFGDGASLAAEDFGRELWLGLAIDGGPELPERLPLTPVPRAIATQLADRGPARVYHLGYRGSAEASGEDLEVLVAALGALAGPKVIDLGPGTFQVSETLVLGNEVVLRGAGRDASVLQGVAAPVVQLSGTRAGLRQLRVEGQALGVQLSGDSQLLHDVEVLAEDGGEPGSPVGIKLDGGSDVRLHDTRVEVVTSDAGSTAVGVSGGGADASPTRLRRCRVEVRGPGTSLTGLAWSGGAGQLLEVVDTWVRVSAQTAGADALGVVAAGDGDVELTASEIQVFDSGGGGDILGMVADLGGELRVAASTVDDAYSGAVCGVHVFTEDFQGAGVPACTP